MSSELTQHIGIDCHGTWIIMRFHIVWSFDSMRSDKPTYISYFFIWNNHRNMVFSSWMNKLHECNGNHTHKLEKYSMYLAKINEIHRIQNKIHRVQFNKKSEYYAFRCNWTYCYHIFPCRRINNLFFPLRPNKKKIWKIMNIGFALHII